jgi:alpha-tubulin suppressor-like RCC1 family protein
MRAARARHVAFAALLAVACGTKPRPGQRNLSPERSTLGASTAQAYADEEATVMLTATARDEAGTPLVARRVEFMVSGTGNRLSASSATTDAAGRASVTLDSSTAESKLVTASVEGVPLLRGLSVEFVAGPPSSLRFAAQPQDAIAGAVFVPVIEVAVMDARGRVVDSGAYRVELALQGGAEGVLHGTLSVTPEGGIASFGDLWLDRTAEDYALVATADGLVSATSDVFAVAPAAADPASSDVVAGSQTVSAGDSTALTVTVRDSFGNPVTGETVSLEATGTGNQLDQPVAATDANGRTAGSLSSSVAGVHTVTGYLAGARALAGVASVTFAPGPAASGPGGSTMVAVPTVGSDDGTPVTLAATIKDRFGNAVPGVAVTFSSSDGATCSSPASPTDAEGEATGSVRSWTTGAQTISASVNGTVVATTEVTFVAAQPSGALSTVMAIPGIAVADGATPSLVTVTVIDKKGRPMAGAFVSLDFTGAGSLAPAAASTDADGRATFQLTAAAPTTGMVTATVGSGADALTLPQGAPVAFAPGHTLGGTISGLVADGLVLASPGLPDLAVAANATTFSFAKLLPEGARYAVTLRHLAAGQVCQVTSGAGSASTADVADVAITCASPAWSTVVSGAGTTYAFNADGSLWAWGWNDWGQIGAAAPLMVSTPFRLGHGFVAVAGGGSHAIALDSTGSLWAWGGNAAGQLGDGTTTSRAEPVLIGAGFARVAAGGSHSLALATDGSLWAWGDNSHGQLGDGTTTSRSAPVLVGSGYSRITAGTSHSLALKSDGTLWAWGENYNGQVGYGSDFTTRRLSPVQIGPGFSEIAASGNRSAGLKADGTLWNWGSGSVGDGTYADRRTPFLVGSGFASVALGPHHACALKDDGTLWAWGTNNYGSVGDGTTTYRTTPVQVATNVAAVAAGGLHTVAVKTDGSLWSWGGNQGGGIRCTDPVWRT